MGAMRNAYNILVGKLERERLRGRRRYRWEDNIIMYLLEKYGGRTWTGSIWLRIETSGGLLRIR
jgi:hypothetical protein